MIKYRTVPWSCDIAVTNIDRETEKSVFINGRKHEKRSECDNYHDTFDEAKSFCTENIEYRIASLEKKIDLEKLALEKLKRKSEKDVYND